MHLPIRRASVEYVMRHLFGVGFQYQRGDRGFILNDTGPMHLDRQEKGPIVYANEAVKVTWAPLSKLSFLGAVLERAVLSNEARWHRLECTAAVLLHIPPEDSSETATLCLSLGWLDATFIKQRYWATGGDILTLPSPNHRLVPFFTIASPSHTG